MAKALSLDRRTRVPAAVAAGARHREAAARFGVGAASAGRGRARQRAQGDARPGAWGGDRRSGRIEARSGLIRRLLDATPDIITSELRRALGGRGFWFGDGTIQRFVRRDRITRKKRPAAPSSRTARTC